MSQKKARARQTMSRRMARAEFERRRAIRRRRLTRVAQIGLPLIVIGGAALLFLALRDGDGESAASAVTDITKSSLPATSTAPPIPGITSTVTSCADKTSDLEGKPQFPAAPSMSIDPAKRYTARIETTKGTMVASLSPTIAPVTVNSFVFLARCGFYDGLTFHRVIDQFVIQGGDPSGTGSGGPGYQLPDEVPPSPGYPLGGLAMANSGPNTSGSQFFVITGPQGEQLPNKYSFFGQVVEGFEVADAIQKVPTAEGDRPVEVVAITKITIEESS